MEYIVYAIFSETHNYIYAGLTANFANRFKSHNSGFERTTKPYRPFIVIYTEVCEDRVKAREREKYWKSGIGKEKLRMIRENLLKVN